MNVSCCTVSSGHKKSAEIIIRYQIQANFKVSDSNVIHCKIIADAVDAWVDIE